MADYVKMDSRIMADEIQSLQDYVNKLPIIIDRLQESLEELGRAWEGDAWLAYQTQMKKDIAYLRDSYEYFSKYINAYSEAQRGYQNAELKIWDEVVSISKYW